ncbi:hypothetical protein F1642_05130 [Paracoccus sp. NBH48]|uniref:hypothetical protein n=1 Tax=Paracoccus sp. NBH48 TaxID=2596918 RepID=UPI001891BE6C|nr:hypothetical protein [Paracoccus sp. NBH48]MBF5078547.1 hypothetical protein [Paracoccus sp. NBH48]
MNAHKKLTILASCPFCGCAAAYYGAAVRCTSFKCNAGLSPNWATKAVRSVQGNPDERLRHAQVETAERWNRRAPQAAPAPYDGTIDRAAIMAAIKAIPRRKEALGGQTLSYVQLSEVLDTIETAAPAPSDALREENERLRYVLDGVRGAISTGRNEPLMVWLDQINIALSTPTEVEA